MPDHDAPKPARPGANCTWGDAEDCKNPECPMRESYDAPKPGPPERVTLWTIRGLHYSPPVSYIRADVHERVVAEDSEAMRIGLELNDVLTEDNARLRGDLETMQEDNDYLRAQLATSEQDNARLRAEAKDLRESWQAAYDVGERADGTVRALRAQLAAVTERMAGCVRCGGDRTLAAVTSVGCPVPGCLCRTAMGGPE